MLFSCSLRLTGEQYQPVRCVEVDVGVVDDSLCDPDTQPQDRYRKCKNMDCPARLPTTSIFFSDSVIIKSILHIPFSHLQVVGWELATLHCDMWARRSALTDGAVCSYRFWGGDRAAPFRVQTFAETQTCSSLQQRSSMWARLDCRRVGRGTHVVFLKLYGFIYDIFS